MHAMHTQVLVASPETCAAVNAEDYWKPLITPMECEIALIKGRSWTGDYAFDFRPLLATPLPEARARGGEGSASDDEDADITHSLTAGTVTVRAAGTVMALSAGEVMMATRSFKGLDVNEGLERPLDIVQGRVGIASGYSHEPAAATNQLHATSVTESTPLHMQGHASDINYRPAAPVSKSIGEQGRVPRTTEESVAERADASDACAPHGQGGVGAADLHVVVGEDVESRRQGDEDSDMLRVAADVDDFLDLLAS